MAYLWPVWKLKDDCHDKTHVQSWLNNQEVQVRENSFYFFHYKGIQNLKFPSLVCQSNIFFIICLFVICLATSVMQMFEYLHD